LRKIPAKLLSIVFISFWDTQ